MLRHPRLSGEEVERRGQALYEQNIRAQVEAGNKGKICTIDVETGDYAVGETMLETGKPLFAKDPGAALWAVRIGFDTVYDCVGGIELGGELSSIAYSTAPRDASPDNRHEAGLP